jgi:hypothetical protein
LKKQGKDTKKETSGANGGRKRIEKVSSSTNAGEGVGSAN